MPRDRSPDLWEALEVTAGLPGGPRRSRPGFLGGAGTTEQTRTQQETSPRQSEGQTRPNFSPSPALWLPASASLWPNRSGSRQVREPKKCLDTIGVSEGRVRGNQHLLMSYLQMAFKEKQAFLSEVGGAGIRHQRGTIWRRDLLSDSAGTTGHRSTACPAVEPLQCESWGVAGSLLRSPRCPLPRLSRG